ncbi:MAG TPA: hypothetical protein VGI74_02515 [Streptosporangiaceae bacterium]
MGFAALITWCGTVLLGLYMLTVWLIENDATGQGDSASQLPTPVVFTHLALALAGLAVWVAYLLTDRERLAWVAVGTLSVIMLLGLVMFARWIPVHRGPDDGAPIHAPFPGEAMAAPPESNFPVAVVTCHGLLAATTYVLVLLTALNIGGS